MCKKVCFVLAALCLLSLAAGAVAGDIVWDFENGNDHGFALKSVVPPTPAPDDPDKAGDESLTGGLPGAGIAWTICDLYEFEGLLPALIEGNNIINGRLVPTNSLPKARGPSPLGQTGYLNTYAITMWGDNLHTAENDQIATSPTIKLGQGSVMTVNAYGGRSTYIAPELDPDATKGYKTGSCGIAVRNMSGEVVSSLLMPSEKGREYTLDLSHLAGQEVYIEVVDAFAGGWGWIAVDQIKITDARLAAEVGLARDPSPRDGDDDVAYDVTLSWTAGEFARTHDVYVGASLEAVEAAGRTNTAGLLFTSLGQTGTTYDFAALLEFGKTYYWRVDEVNAPPDSTVFTGRVWSFQVEPESYEIARVLATASSAKKDMEAEKTVDGSGFNGLTHSTVDKDMWLSSGDPGVTLPAWIMYELPQTCKLHEMRVWNSNQSMETYLGLGAKDVTIEYSLDGMDWTPLRSQQFQQAPGSDDYEGESIPLDGVYAKFVRLTITSNWTGSFPQAGLSEVRFFDIPVRARNPEPGNGATAVPMDSALTWRPGREAVTHEVYLATDRQAVIDGTAPVQVVTEPRLVQTTLEYGKVYYWKVNEPGTEITLSGDVWSFTTPDYELVDDMESYTDRLYEEIWATWLDGTEFGTNDPTNGSVVGADPAAANYNAAAGRAGGQSLPIWFSNTATAPKSEATRTFESARNWSAHGIKSLSLWFLGDPGNSGQLYVKINDTKIPYSGDAADIKSRQWQPWNIDLSAVGTALGSVTKLSVGVEDAGAAGVIYIDDIRLYSRTPEFIIPADPGRTGLQAEYLFDNGATDTSGNGHHGTLLDNAYTLNSVLVLDGTNDAVAIPRIGGATATFKSCTYSMWMFSNVVPPTSGHIGGINFNDWSAGGIHCKISNGKANTGINGLQGGDMWGTTVVGAQEWVHLALTVVNDKATLYLNGKAEVSRTSTTPLNMILGNGCIGAWNNKGDIQRELNGQMDDVRVFDRALSPEEILWLAGKRAPVHMPF